MAQIINSRSASVATGRGSRGKAGRSGGQRAGTASGQTFGAQIRRDRAKVQKPSGTDTVRRSPQQKRAQATTHAIVTAAEQLLVELGYARTSTNAIARRAGVSVGSLYQYFDDKEAVFRAVVQRHRDEMMPLVFAGLEEMADARSDLVGVTLEMMRKLAQVNARNPRLMAAIENELGSLEHGLHATSPILTHVTEVLRSRTTLSSGELAVVARLMVETVEHLARWLVHGKPPEIDAELFIEATGRMLRALLPRVRTSKGCRRTTQGST